VLAGQPVRFTNGDPANHNVRASSGVRTNEFNVYTGINGSYTRSFAATPNHEPVRIGCDIHPWMLAWIYVFDHALFAVTDETGRFRIENVPIGTYTMQSRQPDLRHAQEKTVRVTGTGGSVSIKLEITHQD
jgi:hypothetical protein